METNFTFCQSELEIVGMNLKKLVKKTNNSLSTFWPTFGTNPHEWTDKVSIDVSIHACIIENEAGFILSRALNTSSKLLFEVGARLLIACHKLDKLRSFAEDNDVDFLKDFLVEVDKDIEENEIEIKKNLEKEDPESIILRIKDEK